jgi:hypothetical protein
MGKFKNIQIRVRPKSIEICREQALVELLSIAKNIFKVTDDCEFYMEHISRKKMLTVSRTKGLEKTIVNAHYKKHPYRVNIKGRIDEEDCFLLVGVIYRDIEEYNSIRHLEIIKDDIAFFCILEHVSGLCEPS